MSVSSDVRDNSRRRLLHYSLKTNWLLLAFWVVPSMWSLFNVYRHEYIVDSNVNSDIHCLQFARFEYNFIWYSSSTSSTFSSEIHNFVTTWK